MPVPPADEPTRLLDHAPLLLSLPSSSIPLRGGPYRDMLSQLGRHLEDLGSILVAHSVGRDTPLDSVSPASPTCCSSACAPPRKDGAAKAGQAPVDVQSIPTIKPMVLEAMQRDIQTHLMTIKEQERNEKLWELTAGSKNLPPPLSPWLQDPAVSENGKTLIDKATNTDEAEGVCPAADHIVKDAVLEPSAKPETKSSESVDSVEPASPAAPPRMGPRLTFEDTAHQEDDSAQQHTSEREQHTSEHEGSMAIYQTGDHRAVSIAIPNESGEQEVGKLKKLSYSRRSVGGGEKNTTSMDQQSSLAAARHQKSIALLRSVARQASFSQQQPHKHKKLLIGNGREERQEQKKKLKAATEDLEGKDGKEADPAAFPLQDVLVAVVILLNALVMGISADIEWQVGWDIFEYLFTAFFVGEMVTKMRKLGLKDYFTGSDWTWNMFDFVVVTIAIVDLGFSIAIQAAQAGDSIDLSKFTAVKLARLGRLCRLIRLLRFKMFKELKAMIQGVFAGLRVLAWAIILFFAFIFGLAMVMRNVYMDEEYPYMRESFGTTPWAMFTLFRCFTDGCSAHDGTPLIVHFYDRYGAYFMIIYMLVFLFVTIGLFNLIMAIFVDNVMESTKTMKKLQREANHQTMEGRLREALMFVVKRNWKLLSKRRTMGMMLGKNMEADSADVEDEKARESAVFGRLVSEKYPKTKLIAIKIEIGLKRCFRCCCRRKKSDRDMAEDDVDMPSDMPRDDSNNLVIDRELFNLLIEDPLMDEMLEQLDVSTSNRWELFDVLDADMSGELALDELIVGIMNLRGPTEKSDIVAALLCARNTMQLVQDLQEDHENFATQAMSELCSILSAVQIMARAQLGDDELLDMEEAQGEIRASVRASLQMGQVESMYGRGS